MHKIFRPFVGVMTPGRSQTGLLLLLFATSSILLAEGFHQAPGARTSVSSLRPPRQIHRLPQSRCYALDPAFVTDAALNGGVGGGPQQVAEAMLALLRGPSGVGIFGLTALLIRLYTYFTVQSYIAKLCTLFADNGTTVELRYGNSLRNLFYYEPGPGKMDQLLIPSGDPKNLQTIAEVCARLKVAAKATYSVTALPETFEALKLPAESVDTVVSTYMLNKSKQPLVTFAKAMDMLKDDGVFVFVEPVCGDNPLLGGIRKYLGAIHRATGAFGDPGLDLKNLVNAWAEQVGKAEGIELDLDVEEQSYFLDPHIVGVMYKRKVDRGPDYEPSKSEKRKLARRRGMTTTSKGFGSSS